jgi:hypothetical protein
MPAPWYADHRNLALVAGWLADLGATAKDIVRMLDNPWNWCDEFEVLNAGGTPGECLDDDDDLTGLESQLEAAFHRR